MLNACGPSICLDVYVRVLCVGTVGVYNTHTGPCFGTCSILQGHAKFNQGIHEQFIITIEKQRVMEMGLNTPGTA